MCPERTSKLLRARRESNPRPSDSKCFRELSTALHDSELRAVSGGNALLTVREVAAILRVCRDTVYRLCAKGQLPHVRILNAIRIAPADLDCFLRVHRDCPKSLL